MAALDAACSDSALPSQPDTGTVDVADVGTLPDVEVDAFDADVEPPFDCTQDSALELPTHLRCTGLYDLWSKKRIAPSVREYSPAIPLWSDGASKRRWVMLPPGTKIDTTNMDEWIFPVGTKFWKEFAFADKVVETRLFTKIASATWQHTTYRWSDDQSMATRTDEGAWDGADGGDASAYEIPGSAHCDQCHQGRTDKILGFEAIGLGLPDATGITLANLVSEGLLTAPPAVTSLAIADDGTTVSAPAMGWLHANCGTTCHNENPAALCAFQGMHFRLGFAELTDVTKTGKDYDAYKTTVNKAASVGAAPKIRIKPQDPAGSAVHYFIARRNVSILNDQMPPIDSHVIDPSGVSKIDTWITAIPP